MGVALQDKGDLEAAIDSYKQALKIKPDYAEAYCNLGNALFERDDFDSALQSFQEALRIKPNYVGAYSNLGLIMQRKGDVAGALNQYKQALKLNPHDSEAIQNLGLLLTNARFERSDPVLLSILNSMINKSYCVDALNIANAAISLLKLEPVV